METSEHKRNHFIRESGDIVRILIYGAGVIGCLYGALFAKAGEDVTFYARGRRAEILESKGLRYRERGEVVTANVQVIRHLKPEDRFDVIFLTVKEQQLHKALEDLKENRSPTIVTMVNSLEPYDQWEEICGKGRVVPGFPGAGGGWEDEVLYASLTPRWIQPTTFGEIDGRVSSRIEMLKKLFQRAKIPATTVPDMHAWQICHLAMVVPLADAYYRAKNPARVYLERDVMRDAARELKRNFRALEENEIPISPKKHRLFFWISEALLQRILQLVYRTEFADTFMYRHSMSAPEEMCTLHEKFYDYLNHLKGTYE